MASDRSRTAGLTVTPAPAGGPLFPFEPDVPAAGRREPASLRRRARRLEILSDTAMALLAGKDADREVLPRLAPVLAAEFGVDICFAFDVGEMGEGLRLTFSHGLAEADARQVSKLDFGQGLCGSVAQSHRPVHATHVQHSDDPRASLAKSHGVRGYCCEPLLVGDRLLGTLSFASRSLDRFDRDDLEFFRSLADAFALARQNSARQRVLTDSNRELYHRVKNMLSMVLAIANVSARTAADLPSFIDSFGERMVALGKTQALLGANAGKGARLQELLCAELDPFTEGGRVVIDGPDVGIPAILAVPLGMAIHELTTNAVKYGALAESGGRLTIHWVLARSGQGRRLLIDWIERDGPPVGAPKRRGFGSKLLDRLPGRKIKVQRVFEPQGLRATIEVALG